MYTEADWKQYELMQAKLDEFGEEYIDKVYKGGRGNYFYEHASIEGNFINITHEWSCMGGHDTETDSVPLHYLWTENWLELETVAIQHRKNVEARLVEKRKQEKKEKEEAIEKAKYIEMKAKYGD